MPLLNQIRQYLTEPLPKKEARARARMMWAVIIVIVVGGCVLIFGQTPADLIGPHTSTTQLPPAWQIHK